MKIIVTGGAGFIGSHIADAYIRAGHRVAIIDDLSAGFKKNLNPKAKFYRADIRDSKAVEKIFGREKPNVVNHHAALVSVIESVRNPIRTLETNVIGTLNLILAFGRHGAGRNKKFLFASTGGAIYGSPKKIPAGEHTVPSPLSPYGLSKLLAEEVVKFYGNQFEINYLILRYANVYGPRQNPKGEGGVVAIFGWRMKHGLRPVIFGDGTKIRDYISVEDVVKANMLGIHRGKNETLNLGSGAPVSDKKIFDIVSARLGFARKPVYAPYREGEVYKITLDASRAKKILGWKPSVGLEEGIEKTLESA